MNFNIKKDWKFYAFLIIAIIVIMSISFYRIKLLNLEYVASYNPVSNSEKYDKLYEAKVEGDEIGQTFIAKFNNLEKIYIQFDELKVENSYVLTGGTAIIGIKDMEGNEIYNKQINWMDLLSKPDYIFKFPRIEDSQGKTYYLYIKCDELEEKSEFYKECYSEENLYEDGIMYINGEEQTGDLLFQEMYYNSGKIQQLIIFMFIITAIISLIAITIYTQKDIKVEKLFWYIIPSMFVIFLLIMPTFKSHDEPFHWFRIYDIAQGNYCTQIIENKPATITNETVIDITNIEPEKINYTYIITQIKNTMESSENTIINLSTTSIYNPLQYIPQTVRSFTN